MAKDKKTNVETEEEETTEMEQKDSGNRKGTAGKIILGAVIGAIGATVIGKIIKSKSDATNEYDDSDEEEDDSEENEEESDE